MDTKLVLVNPPVARKRRRHSDEFKAQVISACLQPGVSVAAVALANQLNANLLRTWVKAYRERSSGKALSLSADGREPTAVAPTATLVPVKVQDSVMHAESIRIEIRRPDHEVHVSWPVSEAGLCGQWLRDILG